MLIIYSDIENITLQNFNLIFPLLQPLTHPDWITENSKVTNASWRAQFRLTNNKAEAQVFILSLNLVEYLKNGKWPEALNLVQAAKNARKPIWAFTAGDSGYTPADDYITLLRMGGYRSRNRGNQWVMPPFIEDPLLRFSDGQLTIRPKQTEPVVGFCGQANANTINRLKKVLRTIRLWLKKRLGRYYPDLEKWHESQMLRYRLLKRLEGNKGLKTNFIYRSAYRGGSKTASERQKTTREYFENILNSDYILCLRGEGNYSVRLYETLACGRIPLYVETDSMLPLEKTIDWSRHLLKVDYLQKSHLDQLLVQYHQNINVELFEEIQQGNRQLWLNYLSFPGFWNHFVAAQGFV